VNSDLADGLGNLASRILTMVKNYFDGRPPRPALDLTPWGTVDERRSFLGAQEVFGDTDPPIESFVSPNSEVKDPLTLVKRGFERNFEAMKFSQAIADLWSGIARVDNFLSTNEPWKLAKDPDPEKR